MPELSFKERVVLVMLHSIPRFGDRSLLNYFRLNQDPFEVLDKVEQSYGKSQILPYQAEKIVSDAQEDGIKIIPFFHGDYPKPLKDIFDPPPIIYMKGEYLIDDYRALAVVGTRRYSIYGERVVRKIVPQLVQSRITIVSGMALGIDTLSHQMCIDNNGRTIAVLGSGVDVISPIQNSSLYHQIIKSGCIISEFPLGTEGAKYTFPQRNRIVSGLSMGVCVIEAGEKSGALITAEFGMDQGKDVFCIPGEINSYCSKGTNKLIQNGAKLVSEVSDILEELPIDSSIQSTDRPKFTFSDRIEQEIYELLLKGMLNTDEIICRLSSFQETGVVLAALSKMEIQGYVRRVAGDNYSLT